jgi:competence protein CoiA
MLWANVDGRRSNAYPGANGSCPLCKESMIPKCGEIISWHWAHHTNNCDKWYEPESAWHLKWKARFPKEYQEIIVGAHIADVRTPRTVVEFQSSPLSTIDIREREQHYGRMVWVLNGLEFKENFEIRDQGSYSTFRWKWPRQSWWSAQRPIFIDWGNYALFRINKIHHDIPCGGWGMWFTKEVFVQSCLRQ